MEASSPGGHSNQNDADSPLPSPAGARGRLCAWLAEKRVTAKAADESKGAFTFYFSAVPEKE